MAKEFLWVEIYRPKTIAECILPDRIKNILQSYVDKQMVPNMIFSGRPGIGKTTAAMALCEEIGLNHLLINASKENGIGMIRTKIVNYASTRSLNGKQKVIILDEADNMSMDAQSAFRGTIEEFSKYCTFIITCNFQSKLMDALHSRMPVIDFNLTKAEKSMAIQLFKRVKEILVKEQVQFDDKVVARIVEKYFPDFRRVLGELQKFSGYGKIDESLMDQLSDLKNLKDLVKALKEKKYNDMRKWVTDNSSLDISNIYRKIYDALQDFVDPSSLAMAVLIIAKYMYQSVSAVDQEINLVACLTEMMIDVNFK